MIGVGVGVRVGLRAACVTCCIRILDRASVSALSVSECKSCL